MRERLINRTIDEKYVKDLVEKNGRFLFIFEKPLWDADYGDRTFTCQQTLNCQDIAWVRYEYREATPEDVLMDSFKYSINSGTENSIELADISKGMRRFWDSIRNDYGYDSIIVDITRMNIRMMSAIVSFLPEYPWKHVIFCYCEPEKYKKNYEKNSFELNNVCDGFTELPGLETVVDCSGETYEWIVFLGFDGGRIGLLEREADPKTGYEKPVVCIPPMRAEWHNYAVFANLDFFVERRKAEKLKYVSATNPFDVYNFLVKQKDEIRGTARLLVSPLSTKVTALGTIMYILVNPDDRTLTDNPRQTDNGSSDSGSCHYYDLTEFIATVKNERYECSREE